MCLLPTDPSLLQFNLITQKITYYKRRNKGKKKKIMIEKNNLEASRIRSINFYNFNYIASAMREIFLCLKLIRIELNLLKYLLTYGLIYEMPSNFIWATDVSHIFLLSPLPSLYTLMCDLYNAMSVMWLINVKQISRARSKRNQFRGIFLFVIFVQRQLNCLSKQKI